MESTSKILLNSSEAAPEKNLEAKGLTYHRCLEDGTKFEEVGGEEKCKKGTAWKRLNENLGFSTSMSKTRIQKIKTCLYENLFKICNINRILDRLWACTGKQYIPAKVPKTAWPSDEESALTGVITVPSKKVVL